MLTIRTLRNRFPAAGRVESMCLRPRRGDPPLAVDRAYARAGIGLDGDHYRAADGRRQVTLIQAEHLPVVARLMARPAIAAVDLRRNLTLAGINLAALRGARLRLGEVVVEITGPCHPCSRMEEILGHGGYNAMRGHGGMTGRIVESGWIAVGDAVRVVAPGDEEDDET